MPVLAFPGMKKEADEKKILKESKTIK